MKKGLMWKIIAGALVVALLAGGASFALSGTKGKAAAAYEKSGLTYESGEAVSTDVATAAASMAEMREGLYKKSGSRTDTDDDFDYDNEWNSPNAWDDQNADLDMEDYSITKDKVAKGSALDDTGKDTTNPILNMEEDAKKTSKSQPDGWKGEASKKTSNKKGTVKKVSSVGFKIFETLHEMVFHHQVLGYLETITGQLDVIDDKIDALDDKMDEALRMLGEIQSELVVIETQLDDVLGELDAIEKQLDDVESELIMNQINTYMAEIHTYKNQVADAYGYLITSAGMKVSKNGDETVVTEDSSISETEKLVARNDFLDLVKNEITPGLSTVAGYMYRNGSELDIASGVVNTPNVIDQVIFLNSKHYEYYNQFSTTLDKLYENFGELLIMASLLQKEYYNYYAGPFNPNSPYHDIYNKQLQKLGRYMTELDAVTLSTYAFEYGKPMGDDTMGKHCYQLWPTDKARPYVAVSGIRAADIYRITDGEYVDEHGKKIHYSPYSGVKDDYYGNDFYAGGARYKQVTDFSKMAGYFEGKAADVPYGTYFDDKHGIYLGHLSNGKLDIVDKSLKQLGGGTVDYQQANSYYYDMNLSSGLENCTDLTKCKKISLVQTTQVGFFYEFAE